MCHSSSTLCMMSYITFLQTCLYVTIFAPTGNKNGIGHSPDQFFPVWWKMVWEQDYSVVYSISNDTEAFKFPPPHAGIMSPQTSCPMVRISEGVLHSIQGSLQCRMFSLYPCALCTLDKPLACSALPLPMGLRLSLVSTLAQWINSPLHVECENIIASKVLCTAVWQSQTDSCSVLVVQLWPGLWPQDVVAVGVTLVSLGMFDKPTESLAV